MQDFQGGLTLETIIGNLSLRYPSFNFIEHETAIFFDEIQECPRARLALKNLSESYDVIASGSFLGISGYIKGDSTPVPVGYEDVINMKTLDFEEFLIACGIKEEQIDRLRVSLKEKTPLSETEMSVFSLEFRRYLCVGGFPEAVSNYLESGKRVITAIEKMKSISQEIKGDFGRRKNSDGTPAFNNAEIARIQSAFSLIPTFIAKDSKRYILSKIEGGDGKQKLDSIEYLNQCQLAFKANNIENISLPLNLSVIKNQFKLFPCDPSLFTNTYDTSTLSAFINDYLGDAKGAIYEVAVADSLYKSEVPLYYFAKESGIEVDFVISYEGCPTLLEVKARNGNTKSSKTIMKNPRHYGSDKVNLIKLGLMNIGYENGILSLPYFMTFLLAEKINDIEL